MSLAPRARSGPGWPPLPPWLPADYGEADQALWNRHVLLRNRRGHADRLHHEGRRLLIGRTDGGRWLTFVIEQTTDPTTWSLVTGWDSIPRERMLMEKHGPYRR